MAKESSFKQAKLAPARRRQTKALELRSQGFKWDEIAEKAGYASGGAAYKAYMAVRDRINKQEAETVKEHQAKAAELLDYLLREAVEVLQTTHYLYQQGKPVLDVNGNQVIDDSPKLEAIDRILKVEDRRAKLLGLDTPASAEVGVAVHHTINGVAIEDLR